MSDISGMLPPRLQQRQNQEQDQQLMGQLAQQVGEWSASTGVAAPSQQTVAGWQQAAQGQGVAGQLAAEAQNVGYYWSRDRNLPQTSNQQVMALAQQDPRWGQLDQTGQQVLLEMYNLQAMGYGGSGSKGIGAPAGNGMSSAEQDAWAQLQQTLQQYGFTGSDLSALVQWAQQQIIAGNSSNQIALNLMQTPQFKTRFPAISVLAGEGVAITPAQYIQLEQQYASLERAAGIPPNFASYDELIASQVSPSEYSDRLTKGYLAVQSAPAEVRQAMKDFYGVSDGQLAAYFLDPTKGAPMLMQQAMAAQIGGASAESGFGRVSAEQAFRLAQMGVSYQQAQQGFQQLSQESQLFQPLPGQGQRTNLSSDQLLGAQFGSDGQTKLQLQIQAEQEKGMFAQGTGVAGTQQGLTGAGQVQR